MGKDIQGVMRGKCNACDECEEYLAPAKEGGGARCDYCNHTPSEHVKIIKLGACQCGDCEEYMSEKQNCYTQCDYCACPAIKHKGSEHLRKSAASKSHAPAGRQPDTTTLPSLPAATMVSDQTCKFPGCCRPRYCEAGKQFDFCGKTCGRKYQSIQLASGSRNDGIISLGGRGGSFRRGQAVHSNACSSCGSAAPNPGYRWCQNCYLTSQSQSPSSSGSSKCSS